MFRIEETVAEETVCAVIRYITENRWMICQSVFLIYLAVLSVMDIRSRRISLLLLLAGIPLAVFGFFCGRDISAVILWAGAAVGGVFMAVSRATKEAFGYGDSLLIGIMGMLLGFWNILSVLVTAFLLAALFSVILLFWNHFNRKASFPFIPFLTVAYAGGIFFGGY